MGDLSWAENFEDMKRGEGCPLCKQDRAKEDRFGVRVFEGRYSRAYLQKVEYPLGYTVVEWLGPHVSEPTDLSDLEASAFWLETLRVGRAVDRTFRPLKMNYQVLGNTIPHLHVHVIPRYEADPQPGIPYYPHDRGNPSEEEIRDAAARVSDQITRDS